LFFAGKLINFGDETGNYFLLSTLLRRTCADRTNVIQVYRSLRTECAGKRIGGNTRQLRGDVSLLVLTRDDVLFETSYVVVVHQRKTECTRILTVFALLKNTRQRSDDMNYRRDIIFYIEHQIKFTTLNIDLFRGSPF